MSGDTWNGATWHDHVDATCPLMKSAHGMRAMWCGIFHLVHVSMWHMTHGKWKYEGHMSSERNRKVRESFLFLDQTKENKFIGGERKKERKGEKNKREGHRFESPFCNNEYLFHIDALVFYFSTSGGIGPHVERGC